MSVDVLHDKIRKMKNPSMVDFGITDDLIPPHLLAEEGGFLPAYVRFCRELMAALHGVVPAVRFSFNDFALMNGLQSLSELLKEAKDRKFYVLLDAPGVYTPWGADRIANRIFDSEQYICDGILLVAYIGSDAIKPFIPYCKERGKDLFVLLRSPNKSASEIQDLMTGSRLAHGALADIVNRCGESITTQCGYSNICGVASAGSVSSLRNLRSAYPHLFMLVDGLDYPSGNFKNTGYAFDRMGHGAVVCAGPSVTAAWKAEGVDSKEYTDAALQAAQRMKKNLNRYVSVL